MAKRIGVVIVASSHQKRSGINTNRFLLKLEDDRTVLQYQIDLLRQVFKNPDIVVVTGFEHDKVFNSLKHKIPVVENDLWETTSIMRSITLGLRTLINSKVLIIPACLAFKASCLKGVEDNENGAIISDPRGINSNELGILTENNQVMHFDYDLPIKWSQISFFSGKALHYLRDTCETDMSRYLFHEILNNMFVNTEHRITAIMNRRSRVVEIFSMKDLERIRRLKYASVM
jgi:choline kinase